MLASKTYLLWKHSVTALIPYIYAVVAQKNKLRKLWRSFKIDRKKLKNLRIIIHYCYFQRVEPQTAPISWNSAKEPSSQKRLSNQFSSNIVILHWALHLTPLSSYRWLFWCLVGAVRGVKLQYCLILGQMNTFSQKTKIKVKKNGKFTPGPSET